MAQIVTVAKPSHLPEGQLAAVEAAGRPLAIGKINGQWLAFDDFCTHAGCSFSGEGGIEDGVLICNCHGAKFDLESGAPLRGPAYEPIIIYAISESAAGLEIVVE